MPEISSFADFMADWDRLIKGVQNNQLILPDLEGLVGPLEALLNEAKDLDSAKAASRSQLSQGAKRSRSLIPEGRAAASRLRSALKAHFGGHNEKLVEFASVAIFLFVTCRPLPRSSRAVGNKPPQDTLR